MKNDSLRQLRLQLFSWKFWGNLMDKITNLLKKHYDLEVTNKLPQQGGWAALAFKVYSRESSFS
ncbi:hypothetical protein PbDSM24746_01420 [Paenibacillus macerans]|nr:hypothetical protein PbDSM24746_01420 [Paenibacillus macerans]GBK66434.1 hypothetical protein PbJCM17693_01420 [Paenibacillus macerans]GIP09740.1 hypothetical protein J1TS5_19100 [Paenibacillus macerans]